MEPTTICASLKSSTTHVVTFTNPLNTPTHFQVSLSDTQPAESFCLLLKRTRSILLHPGVSLDIPVMFAPEEMYTHHAIMAVTTEGIRHGNKLVWQYPVTGEPHFRPVSPKSAPRIACQAKERIEKRLEVVLASEAMNKAVTLRPVTPKIDEQTPAVTQTSPGQCQAADSYSYELVCGESGFSSLIQDCVAVTLLRKMRDENDHVKLVFGVVFVPPKALRCTQHTHTHTHTFRHYISCIH